MEKSHSAEAVSDSASAASLPTPPEGKNLAGRRQGSIDEHGSPPSQIDTTPVSPPRNGAEPSSEPAGPALDTLSFTVSIDVTVRGLGRAVRITAAG